MVAVVLHYLAENKELIFPFLEVFEAVPKEELQKKKQNELLYYN